MRVCQVTNDPSEQILAGIEEATGTRPDGCPWQAFRDPFVAEVLKAYRWWKGGQLATVWGADPPAALVRGIEVYDAALNAVQAHDLRKERERREQERKAQQSADMQKRVNRRR